MAKKKKQSGIGAGAIVLVALVGLLGGKDKTEAKPSQWHYSTTSQTVAAATRAPTKAVTEAAAETQAETAAPTEWRGWERDYPVNLNSGVFHKPGAGCIKNSTNIKIVHGTTEDLKDLGYRPCGRCF